MKPTLPIFALFAGALLLAGCQGGSSARGTASMATAPSESSTATAPAPSPATPDQHPSPTLCETLMPLDVIEQCQPDQTLVFLPKRWGNEQFPLIAVALGCDLAQQVVITDGGVVCTVKIPVIAPEPAAQETTGPVSRDARTTG